MNIQDSIGKGSGYIEIAYYMGVNDYFGPRITIRPHETPNYGHGKSEFEIDYYVQKSPPQINRLIYEEHWKNKFKR